MPNHIHHAVEFLRRNGYEMIELNARPHPHDARVCVDVVAWERQSGVMVLFEVNSHTEFTTSIRAVGTERRRFRRRAKLWWCRTNKWSGPCRIDCIDIYNGKDCERPAIDHIRNVRTTK